MKALVLTGLMLAIPGPAQAQDPAWTVNGRIGVVSDYRDRGYTMSDRGPAVQGDVTVGHASGLYGGVWGSSVHQYGVGPDGDGAEVEVILYAGWAGDMAGFEVDVGVWQNLYPDGDEVNYVEFPLKARRDIGDVALSAGVIWAPAQTGTGDEANRWLWTRAAYSPTAWPVRFHATLGREDGGLAPAGKTDWRIGVEAPVGDFVLGVDWVDSDTEDSALVGRVFRNF